ncbi:Dabb family protein [Aestuariibius sp. 2305UL40-4]|uniref:Dabb family protein n=1 Tax=Aestuariibius violaceus TaxID=3234132 RepID=UPI00345E3C3E
MLLHCVFLQFADRYAEAERKEVLRDLGTLKGEVDGMLQYHHGPNLDFESKTPEHKDGFVILFRDREAHLAYERHPKHVRLSARLVEMCVGGADGIVVYDIACEGDTSSQST